MVIEHDSAYLDKWVNSVVELWRSKGIRLESGATQTQLDQTRQILSFHFDSAFCKLYQTVNGFQPFEWNPDMICIWSLPRIVEEFNTRPHPTFIGFADYLIGSHIYGFLGGETGVYKLIDLPEGPVLERIANSFEEGIKLINLNSENFIRSALRAPLTSDRNPSE